MVRPSSEYPHLTWPDASLERFSSDGPLDGLVSIDGEGGKEREEEEREHVDVMVSRARLGPVH